MKFSFVADALIFLAVSGTKGASRKNNDDATEQIISTLIEHPAVNWDVKTPLSSTRKKLKARHLPLFSLDHDESIASDTASSLSSSDLFNHFARTICQTERVARKELFETWAAALYLYHQYFITPDDDIPIRRVADVAGGHGLLAWAILLLDDDRTKSHCYNENNNQRLEPLTAFTLDSTLSKTAVLIEQEMLKEFPQLAGRFDFVEARLEQLQPHPSCLMASVHACAGLSDVLVASAALHRTPLAIVPCCHSRKRRPIESLLDSSPKELQNQYDAILNIPSNERIPNLADQLDQVRINVLKRAGFDVQLKHLPDIFTGKTRLILGVPQSKQSRNHLLDSHRMPPLESLDIKPTFLNNDKLAIPCEDSAAAREVVHSLAGKIAADQRKETRHRRNGVATATLDLSLWLPQSDYDWSHALATFGKDLLLHLEVNPLGDVYTDPKIGRVSRTFRLSYYENAEKAPLSLKEAKKAHRQLCNLIPDRLEGVECR